MRPSLCQSVAAHHFLGFCIVATARQWWLPWLPSGVCADGKFDDLDCSTQRSSRPTPTSSSPAHPISHPRIICSTSATSSTTSSTRARRDAAMSKVALLGVLATDPHYGQLSSAGSGLRCGLCRQGGPLIRDVSYAMPPQGRSNTDLFVRPPCPREGGLRCRPRLGEPGWAFPRNDELSFERVACSWPRSARPDTIAHNPLSGYEH